MKQIGWLWLLTLMVILLGCSSTNIDVDYQSETDFSQINSFVPAAMNDSKDPLTLTRLYQAASANLAQRGWQQRDAEQANGVTLYVSSGKEIRTKEPGMKIGLGGGSYGNSGGISGGVSIPIGEREQQELLIQLDLVQQGELLWRGKNKMVLRRNEAPEERNHKLTKMVDQLLSQFPPAASN